MARGVHRFRARGGALELRALLLGRGRRDRRPLALHRCRPARGAEVLPGHPAGRRGPPRRVLQPVHARGRRRRRQHHGLTARGDRAAAHLGLSQGLRPARDDVRGAAPKADPAQPRCRGHALPHGHRGHAGPARPALHRRLSRAARPDARLSERHGEGRPGRAAPHRLRRQAARRPVPRGPGLQACGGRHAARGDPLHRRRAGAARLGPSLHRGLRLHPRGDRRGGRGLAGDQAAKRRHPDGGSSRPAGVLARSRAARSGPSWARSSCTAASWERRRGRRAAIP